MNPKPIERERLRELLYRAKVIREQASEIHDVILDLVLPEECEAEAEAEAEVY
jgi:hypothetical protein